LLNTLLNKSILFACMFPQSIGHEDIHIGESLKILSQANLYATQFFGNVLLRVFYKDSNEIKKLVKFRKKLQKVSVLCANWYKYIEPEAQFAKASSQVTRPDVRRAAYCERPVKRPSIYFTILVLHSVSDYSVSNKESWSLLEYLNYCKDKGFIQEKAKGHLLYSKCLEYLTLYAKNEEIKNLQYVVTILLK
jgi:hypothetical protein